MFVLAFSVLYFRSFDSEKAQGRLQPAKELQLIQERIEPAVGNAIVDVERLRVVPLMMLRL